MPLKTGKKPGRPLTSATRKRRNEVIKNIGRGMGTTEALVAAGYSERSAQKDGYRIIRHPEIQSRLTESVTRVLTEENKQFDDIVRPYVKALDAKVVVKMPTIGDAVETNVVDHATRMDAATHLAKLYQPKNAEDQEQEDGKSGPPVLLQINFIKAGSQDPAPPVIVSSPHSSQQVPPESRGTPPPVPQVSFVRGKR